MEKELVKILVDGVARHSGIIAPDRELFTRSLTSIDIPESSQFSVTIPDTAHVVDDDGRRHVLSLRRILRNKNASHYYLSPWKKQLEAVASACGFWSSDILTRQLRADKDLVQMMEECKCPYSLLAKFVTYDYSNPDETLFTITKPILVILGAKDTRKISAWEDKNTRYEKEFALLFTKQIQSEEYFSH